MATLLGQRCTVFLDPNGVQRFKIESSIDAVLPGDLPIYGPSPYTSNVFVHQIVIPTDPKSDTFLRVANVADLTTLPLGRETALGLGQTIYMSADFEVIYDDIATASQAKLLIQQRVDNLIADWHAYNDQFLAPLNAPVTPPYTYSEITLPLTNGIIAVRQKAYNDAHAAYLGTKVDSAVAAAALTTGTAAASAANSNATSAVAESQKCSTMLGQFTTGETGINAYRSAVNTFIAASITFEAAAQTYRVSAHDAGANTIFDAAKTAYDSALTTMQAAVVVETTAGGATLTAFHTDMSAACSTKIAAVAIAATAKTTADQAAATASTEKKAADEAESAALIADTTAFLALKEVCPTAERTVP